MPTTLEAPVSRAVCDLVNAQVRESLSWKVTRSDDNSELFEALNEQNVRWKLETNEPGPRCECNETTGTGLPCQHLIALYPQYANGAFSVALIARRWVPDDGISSLPDLPGLSMEELDTIQRTAGAATMEESETNETLSGDGGEDDEVAPLPRGDTQRN
jgi:hypothetical protein